MALTPYCEPDELRAALGVNAIELPDIVLNLPVYKIGLIRELNKLSTSLSAAFLVVQQIPEASRSEQQAALHDATRLFCVYASARQVGVSLGAMLPKDVGDGKGTLSRFSDAPYKDVLERIESWYLSARGALLATLDLQAGNAAPSLMPVMFVAVKRGYDPVTG